MFETVDNNQNDACIYSVLQWRTHSITDPSEPSGYHTYHYKTLQVLPTECIEKFWRLAQQTGRASLFISNYVVFIAEMDCVYCAVRTESTNLTDVSLKGVIVCCLTFKA